MEEINVTKIPIPKPQPIKVYIKINANNETVIITTPDEGIMMLINVLIGLAPSIQAASSSSFGRPLKNCIYM